MKKRKEMTTERDKMLAGRLYNAADPELVDRRKRAKIMTRLINTESSAEQRDALIKTFLGSTGLEVSLGSQFDCDYGSHIYLGEGFQADDNCTLIDVCDIHIGEQARIGANCRILTALHPSSDEEKLSGKEFGQPISIGDNLVMGDGAMILPGVTLGDNVEIEPGTVVNRSFGSDVRIGGDPVRVTRDYSNPYHLTIDIGGHVIKYALIEADLSFVDSGELPTPSSIPDFLRELDRIIDPYRHKIKGIAIACPGEISKDGRVLDGGSVGYLKNYPLAQGLSEKFGLPVSIINDASAAALAETADGALRDVASGTVLVLGTGVSIGLVADKSLVKFPAPGQSLKKAEPSKTHTRLSEIKTALDMNQLALQQIVSNAASAVAFVTDASDLLDLAQPDGQAVFEALEEEEVDPDLLELFQDYCRNIAFLVINLQTHLKLDIVAIGGGISEQPLLIETIIQEYQKLYRSVFGFRYFQPLDIVAAKYQNKATLLGAFLNFQKTKEKS